MAFYNMIGLWRCYAVSSLRVIVLLLQCAAYIRISIKVLIETNEKISNEVIFSCKRNGNFI